MRAAGQPGRRGVRRWRCAAAAARSPYEVLGVARDADLAQIKRAFKQRALKLHPDVNKAVRRHCCSPSMPLLTACWKLPTHSFLYAFACMSGSVQGFLLVWYCTCSPAT